MDGWLIYDERGFKRNKWFACELIKHLNCKLIIVERLEFGADKGIYYKYDGEYLPAPDYAIQRAIYPMLSYTLEADGTRVFNSARVCEICNDKRKTHLLAAGLGIPTVKTAFSDKLFLNVPELPFIIKSAGGHGGSEVFMAQNKIELAGALDSIRDRGLLFQRTVSDIGVDKRVYVLGGKILACVYRRAKSGFKSNFSLGGEAFLCDVSAEEMDIVDKIVNELKPDFAGVDFIYDEGKPMLNEVEDIVGTRMLYELTDIDAAKRYAQYIIGT